jgi:hypothetical protein
MINHLGSSRPTGFRLQVAIGLSTCIVAISLTIIGYFLENSLNPSRAGTQGEQSPSLSVHIREAVQVTQPSSSTDGLVHQSPRREAVSSKEPADLEQEVATVDPINLRNNSRHKSDWHALAAEAATTNAKEFFRTEGMRESMWLQSHSIMFEPVDGSPTMSTEPVLSDLRFKYRSRVVGIGINFGACFFGIPIVGVPIEQRTIAINVFVCGQES